MASAPSFVRGALWMLAAAFSFAVLLASVRWLATTIPAVEIVFFRNLVGLGLAVPLIVHGGLAVLRTERFAMHGLRATLSWLAMLTNFWALSYVGLADTAALLFVIPLFSIVLAALVLKETVDAPRWIAAIIGFGGAMIIIRPGVIPFELPVLVMVLSTIFYAGTWIVLKSLSGTEPAAVTVAYLNILNLPLTLVPSLFVWVTPTLEQIPVILALGLAGWGAHYCQARSFAAADASAVMPIDFMRLPFTAILAFVLFGEASDVWTWVGAIVIFAASTYITRREAMAKRGGPSTTAAPH